MTAPEPDVAAGAAPEADLTGWTAAAVHAPRAIPTTSIARARVPAWC